MAITAADIKLLESERMSDATDGGGRMTSRAIVSGQLSNIFPKVSRTDAVYGRVNLRKIYAAVKSATLDMYGGAHAILSDAPDDAKIGAVLFATGSAFDTRGAARNRIENYVAAAGLSRLRLYGDQIVGSKAVTAYQRVEESLPEAGNVLCLSVEAAGYAAVQQYVRIVDFTHEVRTFTDAQANVDFDRRVLVLKISAPLQQTFVGAEPARTSYNNSPTKIRDTLVADASKYYGIAPLTAGLGANAMEASVASVYGQIVPSTSREAPLSLAEIQGANKVLPCGAAEAIEYLRFTGGGISSSATLRRGIKRGSLTIIRWSLAYIHDDGAGNLLVNSSGAIVGSVDYAMGIIYLTSEYLGGVESAHYVYAVGMAQPAHTQAIPITLATRGTVYVSTLNPLPAPGTVSLDYRALGKWYRLRDNGSGALEGDTLSLGGGSVNYSSGALVITLGALPDVDSALLLSWGSPAHTVLRAGANADASSYVEQTLQVAADKLPLSGTLSVACLINGQTVTASATITDGGQADALTGTGLGGFVNGVTGAITLRYTDKLPDFGSTLNVSLGTVVAAVGGTSLMTGGNIFPSGGVYAMSSKANFGPLATGSLSGNLAVQSNLAAGTVGVKDDGAGHVVVPSGTSVFGVGRTLTAVTIGTVNYTTGDIVIDASFTVTGSNFSSLAGAWVSAPVTLTVNPGADGYFTARLAAAAAAPVASSVSFPVDGTTVSPLRLGLTMTSVLVTVPGSVLFNLAGKTYWDKNGTLYSLNSLDESIASGSIDYQTGQCSLALWNNNTALGLSVLACLTAYGEFTATRANFRTAGSPLRPASTYLQVTTLDGVLISGTADQNGVITGSTMRGTVNQAMGVVDVEFGQLDGATWMPREVLPSTLRYNTVVLTNLPLDASLLGLDPVRLPVDGRVPIFRPGDIVVLHHTTSTTLTNPVTPGNTYSLGRVDLASVSLADSAGLPLLDAEWSADLAAGTVTIAAGAALSGLTQPLVATHRIEQMNLSTDVQVGGQISFSSPTVRAFPSGSLLSSALLFGDLVARVSGVFDQATWTNVWDDALIGSQAGAQYDDVNYPLEVLNNGAITERWRISFTSATAFQVVGENMGQIATGTTSADVSVTSSLTGQPYFVIRAAGWGSGWAVGNQLRFNTVGANAPIWLARTILGGAGLTGDALSVEVRGDAD